MTDKDKDQPKGSLEQHDEWKEGQDAEGENPREMLRRISQVALVMSFDLIDKLRWLEKEAANLSDEEVEERVRLMATFTNHLRTAYLEFSDVGP